MLGTDNIQRLSLFLEEFVTEVKAVDDDTLRKFQIHLSVHNKGPREEWHTVGFLAAANLFVFDELERRNNPPQPLRKVLLCS